MNIIIAASEAVPFCKTGGLADVAGSLAQVLARFEGNHVALFLPRYRNIAGATFSLKVLPGHFLIPVGHHAQTASLSHVRWGNVDVYFVENSKYYDRSGLYMTKSGDYADNDERFIFYSRAVLEGAKFIGFKPDVIHCNDWQSALIPAYIKTFYSTDAFYARTSTLLTIHNIAYQGVFPRETLFKAGFDWVDFTPEKLEYYGGINFLKAGMVFADTLTTVSPTYAREIQSTAEFGMGLEGVLKSRSGEFFGVLNGIDTDVWNPETDTFLAMGYDRRTVAKGKAACKKSLQAACALEQDPGTFVAGVVSRLDPQKGLDVVLETMPEFLGQIQFVMLGVGEQSLQKSFSVLAGKNPKRMFFKAGFDEALAHRIYGGCDVFLMPSRFEPCGLGQMIAMRYGSLPIVSRTGGLADTVFDTGDPEKSNGFLLSSSASSEGLSPAAGTLARALKTAISAYSHRMYWNLMVQNAMGGNYSWDKSAGIYMELYRKARQKIA